MLYSEWGLEYYNTNKDKGFLSMKIYPKADNVSLIMRFSDPQKIFFVHLLLFDWNDLGTWGSSTIRFG